LRAEISVGFFGRIGLAAMRRAPGRDVPMGERMLFWSQAQAA
jgi:hypothetical protein